MKRFLLSAASGIGVAILTFIVLVVLAITKIWDSPSGWAVPFSLFMGILAGRETWKRRATQPERRNLGLE